MLESLVEKLSSVKFFITFPGQLLIFQEIGLNPPLAVFPWDPLTKPVFQLQYELLNAKEYNDIGRDWHSLVISWFSATISFPGIAFLWSSNDVSVASVTQNGLGKTQSDTLPGFTTVRAAMERAAHNYGEAK